MSVTQFDRMFNKRRSQTCTKTVVARPLGNFLPLTGGNLIGKLEMRANNIEFITGAISSNEDISLEINK